RIAVDCVSEKFDNTVHYGEGIIAVVNRALKPDVLLANIDMDRDKKNGETQRSKPERKTNCENHVSDDRKKLKNKHCKFATLGNRKMSNKYPYTVVQVIAR